MGVDKKILLVDDDPDFNMVVRKHLEKQGFKVESAFNGKQGLEKVYAGSPDLIILDVMMPEVDGYTVCSELKKNDAYSDIPVIMLTSVGESVTSYQIEKPPTRYSHADGKSMLADDYLSKPSSAEEITESVKRLLGL